MKAASISEIRKELKNVPEQRLIEYCLRLCRFKKDNKELLTYLLYEADDEVQYRQMIANEIETEFGEIPSNHIYYLKKSLRKILRRVNRYVSYSGNEITEIESRIVFCKKMADGKMLNRGGVIRNIFSGQLKKIESIYSKLNEDIQTDYEKDVLSLRKNS